MGGIEYDADERRYWVTVFGLQFSYSCKLYLDINLYNKNTDSPFSEQACLCCLRKYFLFTSNITKHMNVLCGEKTGFSINKVDDQLDATITIWVRCEGCWSSNTLHTQHTVRAVTFQASDRQQSGCIIPRAVIHSLALLRMGKELPETCWANLKINELLLLHLVGHLLYLCQRCAV